jgi:hypothetical protein
MNDATLPENKLDIHNTKEMLVFLFTFAKIAKEAKANDGKFNANDLVLFMQLFPKVGPAFDDADKILAELKDLDSSESQELLTLVGKEVGVIVSSEKLVGQINAGLVAVKAISEFIKTL